MFKKLNNEKKPSSIMKQILDAIENGILKESDKLPNELDLAKDFGVSRSVVREAMSSLVTMGIVKRVPGNGTYIQNRETSSTPAIQRGTIFWEHLEEIEKVEGSQDAYMAKLLIEPLISEYVARRINKKDLKGLRSIYKDMEKAVAAGDIKKYHEFDKRFHLELAKASGNKVLYEILKNIMDLIGFDLWDDQKVWAKNNQSVIRSLNEHRDLIELFENGTPEGVKNKLEEHLMAAFWEDSEAK